MSLTREKLFIEYPIAKTLNEAIQHVINGGECWQEDSYDWPNCGGFETVKDLKLNFPNGLDETDNVYLVPNKPEMTTDLLPEGLEKL
jgi:hypothetical protein